MIFDEQLLTFYMFKCFIQSSGDSKNQTLLSNFKYEVLIQAYLLLFLTIVL